MKPRRARTPAVKTLTAGCAIAIVLAAGLGIGAAQAQSRAPIPAAPGQESILTNRYNPDYPAGPPYHRLPRPDEIRRRPLAPELRNKMAGTFTIATTGDVHQNVPVAKRTSPALRAVLTGADVTIGNFESDLGTRPDLLAQDMADLGFDLMAPGENGDRKAMRALFDPVGIQIAGNGETLAEARQPAFKEVRQGLVALIAACPGIDLCGDPATDGGRGGAKGGVNPLGLTVWNTVTQQQFDQLKGIRDAMLARRTQPDVAMPSADAPVEAPGRLTFMNTRYMVGDRPGDIHYEADPADARAITLSVRNAKEVADFVVFHMHVHQNRYTFQQYSLDNYPPDFLQPLLHRLIDNGLDMYVGSGNHSMQGIEIYKGRPIFYNQGNLGNSVDHGTMLPPGGGDLTNPERGDRLWGNWFGKAGSSAYIARTSYKDGRLVEVRIYPVDIGLGSGPWSKEHVPTTPTPARAQEILTDIQRFSEPFGTRIAIENGIGIIRVPAAATVDVAGDQAVAEVKPGASVGGDETGPRR